MRWPAFMMVGPFRSTGTGYTSPDPSIEDGSIRLITLNDLEKGQCGLVHDLDLPESDDQRLRTLGICPGRRVWMVRKGDPMILKVMGTRLGLAEELAKRVTVEVCGSGCPGPSYDPTNTAARSAGEAST